MIAEYPGVNGGYPVVAPTRIAVRLIVEAFPQLSREQIQAALDFYCDCPDRVDEDIARNERALHAIHSHPSSGSVG